LSDPYGRNLWGTPPQGCADYAFQQHIQKSMDDKNGRSISLWPHGVLFRDSEAEMRRKMVEEDLVECVIGLGPNLFYNSPMEACLLITTTNKAPNRKGKVLIINALKEVKQEKSISYLEEKHIKRIFDAYHRFEDEEGFCKVVTNEEVCEKKGSLNIAQYVSNVNADHFNLSIDDALDSWNDSSEKLKSSMNDLFQTLSGVK
jgi:type I restriction enzyme M protein